MDAEINNVIYMELNSGPKIASSTCGKTIDVETIDRDSTVFDYACDIVRPKKFIFSTVKGTQVWYKAYTVKGYGTALTA